MGTCVAPTWLQGDIFRNTKAVSRAGPKGKARRSLCSAAIQAVLNPVSNGLGESCFLEVFEHREG